MHLTLAQGQGGTPVDEAHAPGDTWGAMEAGHSGGLVCVDVQPFDSRPYEAEGYAPTGRRGRAATFKSFGALRHVYAASAPLPAAPAHHIHRDVVADPAAGARGGNRFVRAALGAHVCGAGDCGVPTCIAAAAVAAYLGGTAAVATTPPPPPPGDAATTVGAPPPLRPPPPPLTHACLADAARDVAADGRPRVLAPGVLYVPEAGGIGDPAAGEYPASRRVDALLRLGGGGGDEDDGGLARVLRGFLEEAVGGAAPSRVLLRDERGGGGGRGDSAAVAQAFGAGGAWLTLASARCWTDGDGGGGGARVAHVSVNVDALVMAACGVPDVRALWSREGRTRAALAAALPPPPAGARHPLAALRGLAPPYVPPSLFPPAYVHQVSSWVPLGFALRDFNLLLRHIAGDLVAATRVVDVYAAPPGGGGGDAGAGAAGGATAAAAADGREGEVRPGSPASAAASRASRGPDSDDEPPRGGGGGVGGDGAAAAAGRTSVTLEVVYSSVDCALSRAAASSLQFCLRGALATVLDCHVR